MTTTVVKYADKYYFYRLRWCLFFRYKQWGRWSYNSMKDGSSINWCVGFAGAHEYTKEQALDLAKFFASPSGEFEVIWTSAKGKNTAPEEAELTLQLGQALRAGNKEDELRLMAELKQYKYI